MFLPQLYLDLYLRSVVIELCPISTPGVIPELVSHAQLMGKLVATNAAPLGIGFLPDLTHTLPMKQVNSKAGTR